MSQSNTMSLFDQIENSDDIMYLSLLVLAEKSNTDILPEMIYLMDQDSLKNLLYYFGGETIRIPTLQELHLELNSIIMYYYMEIKHKSLEDVLELLRINEPNDSTYVTDLINSKDEVGRILSNIVLPEIRKDITSNDKY